VVFDDTSASPLTSHFKHRGKARGISSERSNGRGRRDEQHRVPDIPSLEEEAIIDAIKHFETIDAGFASLIGRSDHSIDTFALLLR
jgi:hypothetical protein